MKMAISSNESPLRFSFLTLPSGLLPFSDGDEGDDKDDDDGNRNEAGEEWSRTVVAETS